MESYLRFWRLFPRLALGAIFLCLILIIVSGKEASINLLVYIQHVNLDQLGNLSSGILIIILLILFCSLGLFLLELLSYIIGLIFTFIFSLSFITSVPGFRSLSGLTKPISEDLISFLDSDKNDLLEFCYFKSASNPDLMTRTKKVRELIEKAFNHTLHFQNKDLIEGIALYSSVTQDRKWLESVRDTISEIYYLQITLIMGLITLFVFDFGPLFYGFSIFFTVLSLLLLIFLIRKRRRTYAFFILLSYLDNFTTWEAASMVDRDAV
jgi:hypothetical protein